jgi:hypothetical protein
MPRVTGNSLWETPPVEMPCYKSHFEILAQNMLITKCVDNVDILYPKLKISKRKVQLRCLEVSSIDSSAHFLPC